MFLQKIFTFVLILSIFYKPIESLTCFGGLNEFFSDEFLIIENTQYTCGNNTDWDEIINPDGEWFCMVFFKFFSTIMLI